MSPQRVEGHTPTPWGLDTKGEIITKGGSASWDGIPLASCWREDAWCDEGATDESKANAAFIVHACNNIERLEKVNEALVKFVEFYLGTCKFYGVPEHHKELHEDAVALLTLAKEPA